MKQAPFVIERIYNAPAHKVWKAITDKEHMKQWYFDISGFKPEPGFEFSFIGTSPDCIEYVHRCKVIEVVENKKLSYSWQYEGYEGYSVVTFELFEEGNKTRLRLTHEGLETFPASNPDMARENFIAGWTEIVGTLLKEFVEGIFIKKSVIINAAPAKVWEILMKPDYTRQWAAAFSEGAWVETDWQKGSPVIWKDNEGNIGASGVVVEHQAGSLLQVAFYDEPEKADDSQYKETYLLNDRGGASELMIEAGPLSKKDSSSFEPLWDKAIEKMKALAEQ